MTFVDLARRAKKPLTASVWAAAATASSFVFALGVLARLDSEFRGPHTYDDQAGTVPADAMINVESIGVMINAGKIVSVTAGGPAEKAGLQADDVITMIDGDPVSDNGKVVLMST